MGSHRRNAGGRFDLKLTENEVREARALRDAGMSLRAIARTMACNVSTLSRRVGKLEEEEAALAKKRNRPEPTAPLEEERRIALVGAARNIAYKAVLMQSRVGVDLSRLREVRDQATCIELALRRDGVLDGIGPRLEELSVGLLSSESLHALADADRAAVKRAPSTQRAHEVFRRAPIVNAPLPLSRADEGLSAAFAGLEDLIVETLGPVPREQAAEAPVRVDPDPPPSPLRPSLRGADNPKAKLSEEDARAIVASLAEDRHWGATSRIAERFHVSPCTVSAIKAGRAWTHLPRPWVERAAA